MTLLNSSFSLKITNIKNSFHSKFEIRSNISKLSPPSEKVIIVHLIFPYKAMKQIETKLSLNLRIKLGKCYGDILRNFRQFVEPLNISQPSRNRSIVSLSNVNYFSLIITHLQAGSKHNIYKSKNQQKHKTRLASEYNIK